jgi:hypothetical protein
MKTHLTRRRILSAGFTFAIGPIVAKAQGQPKVGMQLILAADVSGSVNTTRYETQQNGYLEALGDSRVLNVIRELEPAALAITFIAWARGQEVMVPWTLVKDSQSMSAFRNRLRNAQRPSIGINTYIGNALMFCGGQFDREFAGGRKVIDVSGDGDDNQGIVQLRQVRDALVSSGVVINGLPIVVRPPDQIFPPQPPEGLEVYYRDHVVGGEGHVVMALIARSARSRVGRARRHVERPRLPRPVGLNGLGCRPAAPRFAPARAATPDRDLTEQGGGGAHGGPSSASQGFKFLSTNFDQFKRKVQSFPVVAKPTLLAISQLVRRRLDLGEEELVVTEYHQIWPSRTATPVVLDQIPEHLDDRGGRKYLDKLPRDLDLVSPPSPQIEPQVVARAQPAIK